MNKLATNVEWKTRPIANCSYRSQVTIADLKSSIGFIIKTMLSFEGHKYIAYFCQFHTFFIMFVS